MAKSIAPKQSKRGGKRTGAGRKKGSLAKLTRTVAAIPVAEDITPLEVMQQAMRSFAELGAWDRAASIAKDCAPYCHPKLSSVEHTGKDGSALIPKRLEIVFVGE